MYVFYRCESLISIIKIDSDIEIKTDALSSSSSLKAINLGNGWYKISDGLFGQCISLTNFIIPDSVIHPFILVIKQLKYTIVNIKRME